MVLHDDLAVIERVRAVTNAWLAGMGLELKPSKTRITHTLVEHDGSVGFDFLGWTVRQFPVGQTHRGKAGLTFKTIIRPSKDAQKRHLADIAATVCRHQQSPLKALVQHLNPKIRAGRRTTRTRCPSGCSVGRTT